MKNEAVSPMASDDLLFTLSQYGYPEIDGLLLSGDPERISLAFRCVERDPLVYYADSLEQLAASKESYAEKAAALLSQCLEANRWPDFYEIATKPGDWNRPVSSVRSSD